MMPKIINLAVAMKQTTSASLANEQKKRQARPERVLGRASALGCRMQSVAGATFYLKAIFQAHKRLHERKDSEGPDFLIEAEMKKILMFS